MRARTSEYGMRTVIAIAIIMGAAPLGPAVALAQGPGARTQLPGIDLPILLDTMAVRFDVKGSEPPIIDAAARAFKELEIPVEAQDPRAGRIRNLRVEKSRRLGGVQMSRYFDCGRGFSGPNADVYRLTLAVSTWVEPGSADTRKLAVAVAATGQDMAGARNDHVLCSSTGRLETRIAERVNALLTSP